MNENENNLIHGRVAATISKFSSQISETYVRCSSLATFVDRTLKLQSGNRNTS